MTLTVPQLNALSAQDATLEFASCCGSESWIAGMLARRPFGSRDCVFLAAEVVFQSLQEADWQDAFAHHPRIGEQRAAKAVSAGTARVSADEQSSIRVAGHAAQLELAHANAEYDQRFGFIFIICASGKSAEDILVALRERMGNSREIELLVAAREQRQITRMRLEKMMLLHGIPQ